VVAVQVFDQRKFKRKDQGFLGVINLKVADVIDLDSGGQGESGDTYTGFGVWISGSTDTSNDDGDPNRDAYKGLEEIE
jgi:hypothetical protein